MDDSNNKDDGSVVGKSEVESVAQPSVPVKPDKSRSVWVLGVLIVLLFAFVVGYVMYNKGLSNCSLSGCDLNSSYNRGYSVGYNSGVNYSYDKGYTQGTAYGLNVSILAFLHYAQNCSVVRVNYSGNIYGFVDATCVIPVNRSVS